MPTIDTTASAFVAGLVTSVHCAGMCGPLACAWLVGNADRPSHPLRDTSLYHGARLASYGIVGFTAEPGRITSVIGPENVYAGDERVGATVKRAYSEATAWVAEHRST